MHIYAIMYMILSKATFTFVYENNTIIRNPDCPCVAVAVTY